jgi:hypothetical protein
MKALTGSEEKEGLRGSAVPGADETGLRVSRRQDWVHVASTEKLTLLTHDRRRGWPALSGIDILPRYEGVCVHDGYSSYDQYGQCRHAQCNAHILRELNYVIETSKAGWAAAMKALLLEIKAAVDKAREGGREKLPPRLKGEFLRRYDAEIETVRGVAAEGAGEETTGGGIADQGGGQEAGLPVGGEAGGGTALHAGLHRPL